MKKRINIFLTLLSLGSLIGCATKTSQVQDRASSYQINATALRHWDSVAREVAWKIAGHPLVAGKTLSLDQPGNSEFLQAFNRILEQELLRNGMKIRPLPEGQLVLSVETQFLQHAEQFSETTARKQNGRPDPTQSELFIFSVAREAGIPRAAVKQIVYVNSSEASLYQLKEGQTFSTSNEP
ncbi:MAG: hypothetical protein M3Y82_14530 [Verrucomicrobiota bacterium]|nr:hypothetical protein [Verrucomicrobiota bacterium]